MSRSWDSRSDERKGVNMDLEALVQVLDYTLDTKRKKHLVGGILLSVSILFAGLALTTMTLKEEKKHEQ